MFRYWTFKANTASHVLPEGRRMQLWVRSRSWHLMSLKECLRFGVARKQVHRPLTCNQGSRHVATRPCRTCGQTGNFFYKFEEILSRRKNRIQCEVRYVTATSILVHNICHSGKQTNKEDALPYKQARLTLVREDSWWGSCCRSSD